MHTVLCLEHYHILISLQKLDIHNMFFSLYHHGGLLQPHYLKIASEPLHQVSEQTLKSGYGGGGCLPCLLGSVPHCWSPLIVY